MTRTSRDPHYYRLDGRRHPNSTDSRGLKGFLTGDHSWFTVAVVVAAFLTSLIGAVGGAFALFDHYKRRHPDLSITVAHDIFDNPHVLRVEIVNDSSAATTLTGGTVFAGDFPVGAILATIDAGARGLNDGSRQVLPAGTRPLPLSLSAGASFSGALVWDEGSSYFPAVVNEFTQAIDHPGRKGPDRLQVRLDFRPGGSKLRPIALPSTRLEDRMRAPYGHARGWNSRPVLDRKRSVKGLLLEYPAGLPTVVLLRLWDATGSKPVLTSTRPLLGVGRRSTFAWNHLKPGRYDWAVSTDAGVVAVGTFITPCTPDHQAEAVLVCAGSR
jgi:hypothetical protein